MTTAASTAAIRELVARNPGQATVEEYQIVHETVVSRRPCNLLVFGAGRDSSLWIAANAGGPTVFLEDAPAWAESVRKDIPGITIHTVRYPTLRVFWPLLRHAPSLLRMRDLPPAVSNGRWDVILVDAPRGTRWYRSGRMMSIYTASRLAREGQKCDVFVHDTHRTVERECCDEFFGPKLFVAQAGTMRHYRVG